MQTRSFPRAGKGVAFGLIALVLLTSTLFGPRSTTAAGYTVTWGPTQVVSDPTLRGIFPSVVEDRNDKMHIVYLIENSSATWDLLYVNNVNGSFTPPQVVQANVGSERTPFFKLVIDSQDTLHLVY